MERCRGKGRKCIPQKVWRLAVLGATAVGKTSLVARLLGYPAPSSYEPTADDLYRHEARCACGQTSLLLEVMDAGGECHYPAMREDFITSADVFIVVFSLDDDTSFKEATFIRNDIMSALDRAKMTLSSQLLRSQSTLSEDDSDWLFVDNCMVLVGNKLEGRGQNVPGLGKQARLSAGTWKCPYVETSAEDGSGVSDLIDNALPLICGNCQWRKEKTGERTRRRRRNWALQSKTAVALYTDNPLATGRHDTVKPSKGAEIPHPSSDSPEVTLSAPIGRAKLKGTLGRIKEP